LNFGKKNLENVNIDVRKKKREDDDKLKKLGADSSLLIQWTCNPTVKIISKILEI